MSPRGDWLALGGDGGGLVVWEWSSKTYVLEQQCQGESVQCLSYSPCGTKETRNWLIVFLYFSINNNLIRLIPNLSTLKHISIIHSLIVVKIATGSADGAVKVWSARTAFCNVTFKNHSSAVTGP